MFSYLSIVSTFGLNYNLRKKYHNVNTECKVVVIHFKHDRFKIELFVNV